MSTPNVAAEVAPVEASTAASESTEISQEASSPEAVATEQSVEEAEAVLDDPNASKSEKKEAKSTIKKFKLKVDGQEIEESINLDDEQELIKHLQLSKVAQKRMNEKATMDKQVEMLLQMLDQDPFEVIRRAGKDPDALVNEYVQRKLDESQKSPEQIEKEKLQKELEELRANQKKAEEERQKAEYERLQAEYSQKLDHDITAALESVKLPKTARSVRYMAELLSVALDNNIELSPQDVAPIVAKQLEDEYKEFIRNSSDDVLDRFIDQEIYGRAQKRRLAKVKRAPETASQIKPTGNVEKKAEPPKKMLIKDWLRGH